MSVKILHIAKDEKFIDSAIRQFEHVKNADSVFYILSKSSNLKYIKQVDKVKCHSKTSTILERINDYEIIIFHSLDMDFTPIILKTNKAQICVWMCFGFEIYNDSFYFNKNNLYGKLTLKETSFNPVSLEKKFKNYLRPLKRLFKSNLPFTTQELKISSVRKMDYLVSSYKEEYLKISRLIYQRKKQLNFTYYPLEYLVDVNDLSIKREKQILVGNSGTLTNNHLDVFNRLKPYQLNDFVILCPLNYGDENYIDLIKVKGELLFNDRFKPLTEFLPIKDYNTHIRRSSIAVFYNFRQQSIGNIIAALWYGAKVYLSQKNSFYTYLKRNKVIVFDFDKSNNDFNTMLDESDVNHNRTILLSLFSEQHLISNLKKDINELIKSNK